MNKQVEPFASPLAGQIRRFLRLKRARGCRYKEEERMLHDLDRFLARCLPKRDPVMTDEINRAYLARRGNESETPRGNRLSLIREFCKFLALEDPRTSVPPTRYLGIRRRPFVPRVLTLEEGRQFLQACLDLPSGRCSPLSGMVHGTALMLLYLSGLRLGEALSLNLEDVDEAGGVLIVRRAKFGKSRLVPMADDLTDRMRQCRSFVEGHLGLRAPTACFFPGPRGQRCSADVIRASFRRALARAEIPYLGPGKGPRLHDLRHGFAVHRMILWYRQGADLNARLPILATYLGHVGLTSSQRYLRVTEDLVGEVTRRYQLRFGSLIRERSAS